MKVLIDSNAYRLDVHGINIIYVDSSKFKALSATIDESNEDTRTEWLYAYAIDHDVDVIFVENSIIALKLKELGIKVVRIV